MRLERRYAVGWDEVGEAGIKGLLDSLLDLYRSRLAKGVLDAITDEKAPPPEITEARERLVQLGNRQKVERESASIVTRIKERFRQPYMRVELDLTVSSELSLFKLFAPYSIAASAYASSSDRPLLTLDDTGWTLTFSASDDLLEELTRRTGVSKQLLTLLDSH